MNREALIGSCILLLISVIVRIIPTFLKLKISEETSDNINNILPIAVLINLLVYCFISEIANSPLAAIAGFIILTALLLLKKINISLVVIIASVTYIAVNFCFPTGS